MTFHFKLPNAETTQDASVLVNLHQELGAEPIEIHPMVAKRIDPSMLEKLRITSAAEGEEVYRAMTAEITQIKSNA
jgi:hypothetical protein